MASKTLMEVFSRYLPDGENRRLMESAHLVGNMRVDKNLRMMELDFSSSSLISKSKLYKLEADIAKAYSLRSVRLFPKYPKELFTEGYFSEIMNEAYRTNLISRSFLQEYRAEFHGYQITIEIPFNDGGVNFVEYNHIGKKIADILHREFGLEYEIHFKKKEGYVFDREAAMQEQLKRFKASAKPVVSERTSAAKPDVSPITEIVEKRASVYDTASPMFTDEDGHCHIGNSIFDFEGALPLIGEPFDITPSPIFFMTKPQGTVVAVGEILGKEIAERKTRGKYKVEFCITDYEATVMIRTGVTDEELPLYQNLSDGMQVAVRGNLYCDSEFDGEIVIEPYAVMQIKKIDRKDDAPEKRVELHLHTNMSQMDAIIPPDVAVKMAHRWGHRAVAITDHGNVQGYQEAMKAAGKLGMKVIYGMEAYFVNDEAKAIYGDSKTTFEDEFVVFDIETTGLSPITCKIRKSARYLSKTMRSWRYSILLSTPKCPFPKRSRS